MAERLEELNKFVKKIGKKLESIGVEYRYSVGNTYMKSVFVDSVNTKVNIEVVDVFFEANDIFIIKGFEIIAVIEHLEKRNLVYVCGNRSLRVDELEILHRLTPKCEHCGYKRNRKKTVVLHNTMDDSLKQIGLSCLNYYLGVDIADKLNFLSNLEGLLAEEMEKYGEEGFRGSFVTGKSMSLVNVIASFFEMMDDKPSIYRNNPDRLTYDFIMASDIKKDNLRLAEEVVRTLANVEVSEDTFMNNLSTLCRNGYIRPKHLKMAAYIPIMYNRYLEKMEKQRKKLEAEAERKERDSKSEYFGNVGDKISNLWVKVGDCLFSKEVEVSYKNWTTMRLYKLYKDNNIIIWYTSSPLRTGCSYLLNGGKITEHKEYEGIKQTYIKRCRVVDSLDDDYFKKSSNTEESD